LVVVLVCLLTMVVARVTILCFVRRVHAKMVPIVPILSLNRVTLVSARLAHWALLVSSVRNLFLVVVPTMLVVRRNTRFPQVVVAQRLQLALVVTGTPYVHANLDPYPVVLPMDSTLTVDATPPMFPSVLKSLLEV